MIDRVIRHVTVRDVGTLSNIDTLFENVRNKYRGKLWIILISN